MKLFNTLTRSVEELKPIDEQNVRVYSCGPTVYNNTQIGNLMSYIFADTLRRALKVGGYEVTQVVNYTDVDDKTIRRSKENYPELEPREALEKLTTYYTELFLEDMKKIGNDINAMTFVRATDHIEAMKQLVAQLFEKGFAYIADDGVYFSIEAYKKSGKTYGQLLKIDAHNTSKERIQNDEYDKESAHDFALWKIQKEGEPAWEFELDGKNLKGRPGWHIECSAMSRQILGQPFDIHTGGVDLIFPHHENEIAQSTAGENNPMMATIFAHNEHLLVDGKKMSKSLNNFYTLDDIIAKNFDPLAFRLLILQSHYRSQAHFSWENLEAASNRLQHWRNIAVLRWQTSDSTAEGFDGDAHQKTILDALQNDLDAPSTLRVIDEAFDSIDPSLINHDSLTNFLQFIDNILGLRLLETTPDVDDTIKDLIAQRESAREKENWQEADRLRTELGVQNIALRDSGGTSFWYRTQ
jgi:cysteinyl-tRNA synthetase